MSVEKTNLLLERLSWILIYAGLGAIVFGMALMSRIPATAWVLIVVGGVVAIAGTVLIWVRSRHD